MTSHRELDKRSLSLAQAVADRIDEAPELLASVRAWADSQTAPAYKEWSRILKGDWPKIRSILLQKTDEGQRLRQSSPFVGILTPQERWKFFPIPKR